MPHHNNVSQLKPYAGRLKTNIVPTRWEVQVTQTSPIQQCNMWCLSAECMKVNLQAEFVSNNSLVCCP